MINWEAVSKRKQALLRALVAEADVLNFDHECELLEKDPGDGSVLLPTEKPSPLGEVWRTAAPSHGRRLHPSKPAPQKKAEGPSEGSSRRRSDDATDQRTRRFIGDREQAERQCQVDRLRQYVGVVDSTCEDLRGFLNQSNSGTVRDIAQLCGEKPADLSTRQQSSDKAKPSSGSYIKSLDQLSQSELLVDELIWQTLAAHVIKYHAWCRQKVRDFLLQPLGEDEYFSSDSDKVVSSARNPAAGEDEGFLAGLQDRLQKVFDSVSSSRHRHKGIPLNQVVAAVKECLFEENKQARVRLSSQAANKPTQIISLPDLEDDLDRMQSSEEADRAAFRMNLCLAETLAAQHRLMMGLVRMQEAASHSKEEEVPPIGDKIKDVLLNNAEILKGLWVMGSWVSDTSALRIVDCDEGLADNARSERFADRSADKLEAILRQDQPKREVRRGKAVKRLQDCAAGVNRLLTAVDAEAKKQQRRRLSLLGPLLDDVDESSDEEENVATEQVENTQRYLISELSQMSALSPEQVFAIVRPGANSDALAAELEAEQEERRLGMISPSKGFGYKKKTPGEKTILAHARILADLRTRKAALDRRLQRAHDNLKFKIGRIVSKDVVREGKMLEEAEKQRRWDMTRRVKDYRSQQMFLREKLESLMRTAKDELQRWSLMQEVHDTAARLEQLKAQTKRKADTAARLATEIEEVRQVLMSATRFCAAVKMLPVSVDPASLKLEKAPWIGRSAPDMKDVAAEVARAFASEGGPLPGGSFSSIIAEVSTISAELRASFLRQGLDGSGLRQRLRQALGDAFRAGSRSEVHMLQILSIGRNRADTGDAAAADAMASGKSEEEWFNAWQTASHGFQVLTALVPRARSKLVEVDFAEDLVSTIGLQEPDKIEQLPRYFDGLVEFKVQHDALRDTARRMAAYLKQASPVNIQLPDDTQTFLQAEWQQLVGGVASEASNALERLASEYEPLRALYMSTGVSWRMVSRQESMALNLVVGRIEEPAGRFFARCCACKWGAWRIISFYQRLAAILEALRHIINLHRVLSVMSSLQASAEDSDGRIAYRDVRCRLNSTQRQAFRNMLLNGALNLCSFAEDLRRAAFDQGSLAADVAKVLGIVKEIGQGAKLPDVYVKYAPVVQYGEVYAALVVREEEAHEHMRSSLELLRHCLESLRTSTLSMPDLLASGSRGLDSLLHFWWLEVALLSCVSDGTGLRSWRRQMYRLLDTGQLRRSVENRRAGGLLAELERFEQHTPRLPTAAQFQDWAAVLQTETQVLLANFSPAERAGITWCLGSQDLGCMGEETLLDFCRASVLPQSQDCTPFLWGFGCFHDADIEDAALDGFPPNMDMVDQSDTASVLSVASKVSALGRLRRGGQVAAHLGSLQKAATSQAGSPRKGSVASRRASLLSQDSNIRLRLRRLRRRASAASDMPGSPTLPEDEEYFEEQDELLEDEDFLGEEEEDEGGAALAEEESPQEEHPSLSTSSEGQDVEGIIRHASGMYQAAVVEDGVGERTFHWKPSTDTPSQGSESQEAPPSEEAEKLETAQRLSLGEAMQPAGRRMARVKTHSGAEMRTAKKPPRDAMAMLRSKSHGDLGLRQRQPPEEVQPGDPETQDFSASASSSASAEQEESESKDGASESSSPDRPVRPESSDSNEDSLQTNSAASHTDLSEDLEDDVQDADAPAEAEAEAVSSSKLQASEKPSDRRAESRQSSQLRSHSSSPVHDEDEQLRMLSQASSSSWWGELRASPKATGTRDDGSTSEKIDEELPDNNEVGDEDERMLQMILVPEPRFLRDLSSMKSSELSRFLRSLPASEAAAEIHSRAKEDFQQRLADLDTRAQAAMKMGYREKKDNLKQVKKARAALGTHARLLASQAKDAMQKQASKIQEVAAEKALHVQGILERWRRFDSTHDDQNILDERAAMPFMKRKGILIDRLREHKKVASELEAAINAAMTLSAKLLENKQAQAQMSVSLIWILEQTGSFSESDLREMRFELHRQKQELLQSQAARLEEEQRLRESRASLQQETVKEVQALREMMKHLGDYDAMCDGDEADAADDAEELTDVCASTDDEVANLGSASDPVNQTLKDIGYATRLLSVRRWKNLRKRRDKALSVLGAIEEEELQDLQARQEEVERGTAAILQCQVDISEALLREAEDKAFQATRIARRRSVMPARQGPGSSVTSPAMSPKGTRRSAAAASSSTSPVSTPLTRAARRRATYAAAQGPASLGAQLQAAVSKAAAGPDSALGADNQTEQSPDEGASPWESITRTRRRSNTASPSSMVPRRSTSATPRKKSTAPARASKANLPIVTDASPGPQQAEDAEVASPPAFFPQVSAGERTSLSSLESGVAASAMGSVLESADERFGDAGSIGEDPNEQEIQAEAADAQMGVLDATTQVAVKREELLAYQAQLAKTKVDRQRDAPLTVHFEDSMGDFEQALSGLDAKAAELRRGEVAARTTLQKMILQSLELKREFMGRAAARQEDGEPLNRRSSFGDADEKEARSMRQSEMKILASHQRIFGIKQQEVEVQESIVAHISERLAELAEAPTSSVFPMRLADDKVKLEAKLEDARQRLQVHLASRQKAEQELEKAAEACQLRISSMLTSSTTEGNDDTGAAAPAPGTKMTMQRRNAASMGVLAMLSLSMQSQWVLLECFTAWCGQVSTGKLGGQGSPVSSEVPGPGLDISAGTDSSWLQIKPLADKTPKAATKRRPPSAPGTEEIKAVVGELLSRPTAFNASQLPGGPQPERDVQLGVMGTQVSPKKEAKKGATARDQRGSQSKEESAVEKLLGKAENGHATEAVQEAPPSQHRQVGAKPALKPGELPPGWAQVAKKPSKDAPPAAPDASTWFSGLAVRDLSHIVSPAPGAPGACGDGATKDMEEPMPEPAPANQQQQQGDAASPPGMLVRSAVPIPHAEDGAAEREPEIQPSFTDDSDSEGSVKVTLAQPQARGGLMETEQDRREFGPSTREQQLGPHAATAAEMPPEVPELADSEGEATALAEASARQSVVSEVQSEVERRAALPRQRISGGYVVPKAYTKALEKAAFGLHRGRAPEATAPAGSKDSKDDSTSSSAKPLQPFTLDALGLDVAALQAHVHSQPNQQEEHPPEKVRRVANAAAAEAHEHAPQSDIDFTELLKRKVEVPKPRVAAAAKEEATPHAAEIVPVVRHERAPLGPLGLQVADKLAPQLELVPLDGELSEPVPAKLLRSAIPRVSPQAPPQPPPPEAQSLRLTSRELPQLASPRSSAPPVPLPSARGQRPSPPESSPLIIEKPKAPPSAPKPPLQSRALPTRAQPHTRHSFPPSTAGDAGRTWLSDVSPTSSSAQSSITLPPIDHLPFTSMVLKRQLAPEGDFNPPPKLDPSRMHSESYLSWHLNHLAGHIAGPKALGVEELHKKRKVSDRMFKEGIDSVEADTGGKEDLDDHDSDDGSTSGPIISPTRGPSTLRPTTLSGSPSKIGASIPPQQGTVPQATPTVEDLSLDAVWQQCLKEANVAPNSRYYPGAPQLETFQEVS